jgi:hypothetical protein
MGLLCPTLVAYFFAPDGVLLRTEERPWDYPAPRLHGTGPYSIYDPEFRSKLQLQFASWQAEIGFRPEVIWIQAFLDLERFVGIEAIPEHLLTGEEDEDAAECIEREKALQDWIANGNFVFWWAKDYYMSKDGEVEST